VGTGVWWTLCGRLRVSDAKPAERSHLIATEGRTCFSSAKALIDAISWSASRTVRRRSLVKLILQCGADYL
jgi:hypothetical protein